MRPYTVDANAINEFQKERLRDEKGMAHEAIERVFADDCIALDEGGLCQQEWENCAGGHFPLALIDWIADQMIYGRIRKFKLAPNTIRKDLLRVGLPQDDHKWVRLAIGSDGFRILSGDIDFLDPKKKRASVEERQRLRRGGKGPCSKLLDKKFGIKVLCLEHFCGN